MSRGYLNQEFFVPFIVGYGEIIGSATNLTVLNILLRLALGSIDKGVIEFPAVCTAEGRRMI